MPHTDLDAVLLHFVDTVLETVRETQRRRFEGIERGGVHESKHLASCAVSLALKFLYVRPHIVENSPSYRNILVLELPALCEKLILADLNVESVPRTPTEVLEYFGVGSVLTHLYLVAEHMYGKLKRTVEKLIRIRTRASDESKRLALDHAVVPAVNSRT